MGKVAQILVTLTSHCDFHFKHLNMRFIENKLIVDLNNSNCHFWIIRLLHISLWKTMGKSGADSGYSYITVIFISNI